MRREELRKLILGPASAMPTPFDRHGKVDLGVVADMTRYWVAQGIVAGKGMIKVTSGADAPDLSDEDWANILRATALAAGGKATLACGLKCKNTRQTIADARKAAGLGVVAVQIDLPYQKFPTQDDILRFYMEISEAIDIGIILNNAFWFGAPGIATETLLKLADAEHLVAIKWVAPDDAQYDDMRQFAHIFNVIDNSGQPVRCHKNGGRGYVEGTFAAYPAHGFRVWELLEAGRYDEAQALFESVSKPMGAAGAQLDKRYGGDRTGKALMRLMGFPAGDPQSPTAPLSDAEMAVLRETVRGFGWPTRG